jgi:hypothetical protein
MRRLLFILFLVRLALPAFAEKAAPVEKVLVAQMEQALATAHERPDAEVAQQLLNMELTERLSSAKLAELEARLPGDKAKEVLVELADSSLLLDPPQAEIPADVAPNAAAAHQMLAQVVDYVNTTLRQLPNFIAARDTTAYEDRPAEDIQESTDMISLSYLPLHVVGRSSVTVTYRDSREVIDEKAAKATKHGPQVRGLETGGVFGPILSVVLGDALKGKITWGHWEKGAGGTEAVFHYAVPKDKSNYKVQFCCISGGVDENIGGQSDWRVFSELAAYHGEIAFEPANGAILRMTLEAEMPPNEIVSKASMLVEYGPVQIGGKSYVCPTKSVSILSAHTTQSAHGVQSATSYKRQIKTFLNDVAFRQYRRFGSETRILTGNEGDPNQPSGPTSADSPYAAPSRAPTH